MSESNRNTGYTVSLRFEPGIGFAVEITTRDGEHQKAPEPLQTLGAAFNRASKVLQQAGFTVEIAG